MRRGVELEIGELVLTGLGRAEGERVADSFAIELERLCADGLEPSVRGALERLPAESIVVGPRTEPERIGADAARSVHRSLGG